MNRFPKDCWGKNCPHFHVVDMSIDDLLCTCDILQKKCDACEEDFCFLLCPLSERPPEGEAAEYHSMFAAMLEESMPNESLPVLVNDEQGREYIDYICPRCKGIISQRRRGQRMETVYQCKFHDNCGQRVDWENQQSYCRPPEGEEDT